MNSPAGTSFEQALNGRPGVTPPSQHVSSHSFLSDALVARGLISQEAMDAALQASRDGRRYGDILVSDRIIDEDDFARAMADHHAVDHVDLDAFDTESRAIALVSQDVARRNGALPIAVLPTGEVVVAIHDPALTNLVELADVTRSPIRAVIASRSQIDRYLGAPTIAEARAGIPARPQPAAVPVADHVDVPEPAAGDRAPADDLAERLARAESEARDAQERARLAERRAEGMVAAAQATSDALAQLSQARAAADEGARAGAHVVEALRGELAGIRAELEAERTERRRVEAELLALRAASGRTADEAGRAPERLALVPAPAGDAARRVPQPVAAPRPPIAAVPPQPAPAPRPAPAPQPSVPPQARPSAMPPVTARAVTQSSKKRGLRRMIAALRRT